MDKRPIKVYKDVNTVKTVRSRKAAGKTLLNVIKRILAEGYNPFEKTRQISCPLVSSGKASKPRFQEALITNFKDMEGFTIQDGHDAMSPILRFTAMPSKFLARTCLTSYMHLLPHIQ